MLKCSRSTLSRNLVYGTYTTITAPFLVSNTTTIVVPLHVSSNHKQEGEKFTESLRTKHDRALSVKSELSPPTKLKGSMKTVGLANLSYLGPSRDLSVRCRCSFTA